MSVTVWLAAKVEFHWYSSQLRMLNTRQCFELIVRRSFVEYTALWLHDAALEYGCAVVPPQ